MKHTGLVLIALIFVGGLVFAAGCIGTPETQSPEGKWILANVISDFPVEFPMGVVSLEINGTSVSGSSGVNQYSGSITLDTANAKITFSPLASTKMAGSEAMMAQEQKYFAILANVTDYKIVDGILVIDDNKGSGLIFAAMPAKTLDGTSWTLADNTNVTIEFVNGNVAGQAPVNRYSGVWYVAGTNIISFDPFASTLMAGPEDKMNAETEFFGKLANVTGYKIEGSKLTLTDSNGATLLTFSEAADTTHAPAAVIGNWTLSTDKSVTLNFYEDGMFGGQAPVNGYGGSYTENADGTFTLSHGIRTQVESVFEERNKAETEFFASLGKVTGCKIEGSKLMLTDSNGAALLTFNEAADPVPSAITGNWTLSTDKNVTLNFGEDGRVGGQAPVNGYGGSYTEGADGALTFSEIIHTLMASLSEEQNKAETEFFAALDNVAGYKIADGKLHLTDASGTTLLTFE